jgi:hypothetical protein
LEDCLPLTQTQRNQVLPRSFRAEKALIESNLRALALGGLLACGAKRAEGRLHPPRAV